jgi:Ca2+-binding RTX toxin-like protein
MAVGGEIQVNVEDHAERDPVITASSDGSFLVLWNRVGGEFSYGGTLARRFSPVASMVGDTGDNELTGTASADTFEGLGGNDVIAGLSGNDILTGGEGSDRLFGGAGNDTLSAENMIAFDVGATVDYLYGGDGNDIIFSGFGDIVDGGQGFDTVGLSYVGASHGITGDTAILHRGEPLIAGGGTFHSIERFSDIAMTQFDDKMVIGDQKDSATVRGWNGNDHLIGQEMSITMYGGNGNDLLVGSTANDLLYGDDGNDILIGHLGMDSLWGGAGADRFIINQLDVLDRIIDFEHGVDKIDVSDIDADISTAGNQAFTFIGTGNFTGAAGQLRIAFTSSATYMVEGDVNGDGKADLIIDLGFPSALTQGDFLL